LKQVTSLSQIKQSVAEAFEMVLAHEIGEHVEPFVHNANLIGYILMHCGAQDYTEVRSRLQNVLQIEVAE